MLAWPLIPIAKDRASETLSLGGNFFPFESFEELLPEGKEILRSGSTDSSLDPALQEDCAELPVQESAKDPSVVSVADPPRAIASLLRVGSAGFDFPVGA